MATEDDEVSLSVSAQLDAAERGGSISASTRSRAVAALDRLIGAIFDWPAAKVDGRIDAIKHEGELMRKFRDAQADAILAAIEAGDTEKARMLQINAATNQREFRKTLNLAAVSEQAMFLLSDQSSSEETLDDTDHLEIDDEWMNRFSHFASEATSADLRGLWARVLAGEVRRPGSFSASSLRFIFELDKTLAETCERFATRVLKDQVIVGEEDKSGQNLADGLTLEAAGLLSAVGGNITRSFNVNEDCVFQVVGGEWALKGRTKSPTTISFEAWLVTRVGREIFSLLDVGDEADKMRKLGTVLIKKYGPSLKSLDLLRLGGYISADVRHILSSEDLLL